MEKNQEPIRELLKDLRDETQTLVRQEAELVRTETREKMRLAMRQLVLIGVGAAVLLAGLIELLAALDRGLTALLVEGMGLQVAAWLAPLILAVLFLAGGAFLMSRSVDRLKEDTRPEHTLHSFQKTKRWAKDQAERRTA